jgi:peroxiredoxin
MVIAVFLANIVIAQSPVTVGDTMPNFSLQSVDGKMVSLKDYKGKNVMLVFPRGRVADHWCQICHYQYAELADLETKDKFEEKNNLQVLFILPYNKSTVIKWSKMFPDQLKVIDKWKNPDNQDKISESDKNWMNTTRKLFPKNFKFDSTNIPNQFPILADEEREYSLKLGLFTTFWDYSYVEQNISSVFIIDKNGILQFKYVSQSTMDRPSPEYLLNFIKKMMNDK